MTTFSYIHAGPDGRLPPLQDEVRTVPCPGCGQASAVRRDFERAQEPSGDGGAVLVHQHYSLICRCGYRYCDLLHPYALLWRHTCGAGAAPASQASGRDCMACAERAMHGLLPGDGEPSNLSLAYMAIRADLDIEDLARWKIDAAVWCFRLLGLGGRSVACARVQLAFARTVERRSYLLGAQLQAKAMRTVRRLAIAARDQAPPRILRGQPDLLMAWDDGARLLRAHRHRGLAARRAA